MCVCVDGGVRVGGVVGAACFDGAGGFDAVVVVGSVDSVQDDRIQWQLFLRNATIRSKSNMSFQMPLSIYMQLFVQNAASSSKTVFSFEMRLFHSIYTFRFICIFRSQYNSLCQI